ncbi:glycosyltransferase [Agromyces sp. NPDC058110]|uniref:glycosyltransferase n=1 Tax=Agromyces sp. NPDC058110 TaxID=3346345 RepID=UPI0036DDBFE6
MDGRIEVSVVVATFSPPAVGLERLVMSLDAQTLPADEFEVVFVDDGSPDDTVERLRAVAATRPNVRVERIENSGWASRPRNVGIELARGRYVLFMDHDDVLYPRALESATAFARRHDADVVNGKEARTHDAGWAIASYRADSANDVGRVDQHPLVPMNPHKLYRTEFLREHGIRFPEGRRVLWEDIAFNTSVARHARVVSTLATVPFYHWVQTPGSGSTTFRRSDPEWWDRLDQVVEAIDRELAEQATARRQLLRHQYVSRVLASFTPAFVDRPAEEQRMIVDRASVMQSRYFTTGLDDELDASARVVARALRHGDRELLDAVAAQAGRDRFADARITSAEWHDGRLHLTGLAATVPRLPGGGTFEVVDGAMLPMSAEVCLELGTPADFDVRGELESTRVELLTRGRSSRVVWQLPSAAHEVEIEVSADGREAAASIRVSAVLDVADAALGSPLETEVQDLALRTERAGRVQAPRVATAVRTASAIVDGRTATVYANREGLASLDIGDRVTSVFDSVRPLEVMGTSRDGDRTVVRLGVVGLSLRGERPATGTVMLSARRLGWFARVGAVVRHRLGRSRPADRHRVTIVPLLAGRAGAASVSIRLRDGVYRWHPAERSAHLAPWTLRVRGERVDLRLHR